MTPLVNRLSIYNNKVEQWAETIIKQHAASRDRSLYARQIADAGYDIGQNARWLEEYYLSLNECEF